MVEFIELIISILVPLIRSDSVMKIATVELVWFLAAQSHCFKEKGLIFITK